MKMFQSGGAYKRDARVRLFFLYADELTLKQAPATHHDYRAPLRHPGAYGAGVGDHRKGFQAALLSRTRRSGQRRIIDAKCGAVRSRQPPAASMSTRASVFEWVWS